MALLLQPALLGGRALAEARMTDECTIASQTAQPFNATTGDYPAPTTSSITTACYVRRETPTERQVEAGDRAVALRRYIVSVPVSVVGVLPLDVVTITASGDPDLLDAVLVVRDVAQGTHVTARRLGCEVGT
jgi:hypothetical protein